MKKLLLAIGLLSFLNITAQVSWQSGSNPESNQAGTILFNKAGTLLSTYTGTIYAHTGVTLNGKAWQNVIGFWGNNTQQPALTFVSGTTYKLDLTPSILAYYGLTEGAVTKVNLVFRSASGAQQTADLELNVGAFQASLIAPLENSTSILNSGQNLQISASTTSAATFNLYKNGTVINTNTGTSYSYLDTNNLSSANYDLQISNGAVSFSKKFYSLIKPNTITESIPAGVEDGINYNPTDATKAIVVLDAPNKDFVYVAGSFNNWQPKENYAMKKDPASTKFWLEITGLTADKTETFQYWVVKQNPIANSPVLVKTADPYSTLVLSPFDDPTIPTTSYPNLPIYPAGQEREVTVLKTGQKPYNWSNATTNFVKPNKDKLVVYEVLVRDFDANRNFQNLIERMDYFKNLKVNAIELMPVMEFEGNESWGYNTAFHLALDKYYGPESKLKEFIDLCHQNNIAVILDVALNHAFGRNPMLRMWMNDPDGDGWGSPSSENPYFNQVATHSYSVGEDFNHQQTRTKNYVKRVVKHWIEDFKIDGFRWDLTKGFTQNCAGSEACTNAFQQDRVTVLKEYADYSWSLDANHYVIFEHLGQDAEEKQWADYRLNEGKGIMLWGEMYEPYKQLGSGFTANADITRIGNVAHGFAGKRLIGYPESHDKERIVYQSISTGNTAGTKPIKGNLTNAIQRMAAIGATSILVPGPKMIWNFGELGMDNSIYTCTNATVNTESDTATGNCKLDTKPQPQWFGNWLADSNRGQVYNSWAKCIDLKLNFPVFNGDYSISPDGNNLNQRIYIFDNSLPSTQLKNVVVLANFNSSDSSINPNFPTSGFTYPMTWYDLMNASSITVNNPTDLMLLKPGEFKVFGNQQAVLANPSFSLNSDFILYPNPVNNWFETNTDAKEIVVYSLTGQQVLNKKEIKKNQRIDISNLEKGFYIVRITDNDNNQTAKKILKN